MPAIVSNMYNSNRMDLGKEVPLSTPLVIQLEASGFCNLGCRFCPCGDETSRNLLKQDVMSFELFTSFVEQCKKFDKPIKVLRIIGIGEPLLNKNIVRYVELAKTSGVFEKVEITSNGTLLTKELSDGFIDAGLDTLLISLEAIDEKTFFEITNRHVDIAQLKSNLEYFYLRSRSTNVKLYIKTVSNSIRISEQFLEEYKDICDFIYVENIIENWPDFEAGAEQNSVRYDHDAYKKSKKVCVQPFKLLCVCANGDVVGCCVDWKREILLGNIVEESITEIWNGEKHVELLETLLKDTKKEICKKCGYTAQNQPDDIDDSVGEILHRLDCKQKTTNINIRK